MDKLTIVKIGGNVIDSEEALEKFVDGFAKLKGKKLLVHGGGAVASNLGKQMGIKPNLVDGRRITDAETLKIVTMVYAGLINKSIVAALQAKQCNAIGLSGADGNTILAHKRIGTAIDYGFVGDIDKVDQKFLGTLIESGAIPVFSAITHDGKGTLLNTNADTIARALAGALASSYNVSLVYTFEKQGVLEDPEDDQSVINELNPANYEDYKASGAISGGMIPKLDNSFEALEDGVKEVIITSLNYFKESSALKTVMKLN